MMKQIKIYDEKYNLHTCFVGGTLVHTQNGLVRIEKIKVGDMVLSKPESGIGEPCYRPVTRTFVHQNEIVMLLKIDSDTIQPSGQNGLQKRKMQNQFIRLPNGETKSIRKRQDWAHYICVTPNHHFHLKDIDWAVADKINYGTRVQILDGNYKGVHVARDLFATDTLHIGWMPWEGHWGEVGTVFDTRPSQLTGRKSYKYQSYDKVGFKTPLRTSVYDIEVQDHHTYYVGDLGLWAHDRNSSHNNTAVAEIQANNLQ